jgi:hypothetical protein
MYLVENLSSHAIAHDFSCRFLTLTARVQPQFSSCGLVVYKIKQRHISFSNFYFTQCFISVIFHPHLRVKYQGTWSHPTRRMKIKGSIQGFV